MITVLSPGGRDATCGCVDAGDCSDIVAVDTGFVAAESGADTDVTALSCALKAGPSGSVEGEEWTGMESCFFGAVLVNVVVWQAAAIRLKTNTGQMTAIRGMAEIS